MCVSVDSDVFVGLKTWVVTVQFKWIAPFSCSPDQGSGWIAAPVFTPCFSGFRTPQRKRRKKKTRAKEKQQNRHLPMIQRNGPQDDWKVRMSHFPLHVHPFIIWALYRWEPVDALSGIGLFELPSNHSDIASHLLYVKTAQRAIWLWVMEGGLNSPSEILEPVGKPQLFKCRKSWFYKMLIWSALGTGEQKKTPTPPPSL